MVLTKIHRTIITGLVVNGWSYEQIAQKLHYSRSAIGYHVNKIYKYFGVKNRMELILKLVDERRS